MIGYFHVLDKKTKEVLMYYKYASINDIQRQNLRKNPNILLVCACNDKNLEVKISSDLRIYPAEQKVGHLHEKRCPKYIDFVPEKLWNRQETGTSIYYNVASHEATAKDYFEKINFLTHWRLTHPENRLPDNYKDFNKKCIGTTKYIKTPNGEIIYDILLSNNRNLKDLPAYKEYFIYGEVLAFTQTTFSPDLYYIDIADAYEHRSRFYIEKPVIEAILNPDTFDNSKVKYIGGGFIFKKKLTSTILSLSDFYMAKIDTLGLIASTKEKINEK